MKYIKYLLIVLAVPFFSKCTDLTEETYTFLSPSNFYETSEDLEMALVSVYDAYQSAFGGDNYKYYMYLEVLTEYGSPAYAKDNVHLWNSWYDVNNPSMTLDIWSKSYSIINKANTVLARGEGVDMDETLKKQYYAEARFIRALTYYNLVRIYGGVAIPESFTNSLEGLEIPRKTSEETYDYIVADLEYASANLPLKSAYDASDKWKATKGAADAFLGSVYLTRASMDGSNEYYQKSKEYSQKVIDSKEYQLEPDYKNLWYWWNQNCKNGQESIFELQYGVDKVNWLHQMLGINATDVSLGSFMWRRFGPSIQAYTSYSDQDSRKEATFLTSYTRTSDGQVISYVPGDLGFYPGSQGWNTASPGNIKYYDRSDESANLSKPHSNLYVMRYSEVLLNYAEAENQLNGPSDDVYGKVNAVRNRAQLDDLSGLSKEELDDAIFQERGWEFIGEVKLYFDELRTDRLGKNVQAGFKYGIDNGIYMYKGSQLGFVPQKTFLWKIPVYDLNSNPALEQNPDNVSQ